MRYFLDFKVKCQPFFQIGNHSKSAGKPILGGRQAGGWLRVLFCLGVLAATEISDSEPCEGACSDTNPYIAIIMMIVSLNVRYARPPSAFFPSFLLAAFFGENHPRHDPSH